VINDAVRLIEVFDKTIVRIIEEGPRRATSR